MTARDDLRRVRHRRIQLGDVDCFYREAGPPDAPALILPHGYPCSSYEFRNLMPLLAHRWRVLAPDFPGSGYTGEPPGFPHGFDGYAEFLNGFTEAVGADRFALYLHDFGGWIGLRLAMRWPEKITALVIQNVDIYEDAFGPKYAGLKAFAANPTPEARAKLGDAVNLEGFREEFLNEVAPELAERISPDLWTLHWSLMTRERREIAIEVIAGWKDNLAWFPRYQAWLREHRPPTLIVWGPQDGYMPEGAARAYLRDLPDAELHLLNGGHWLLETSLDEVAELMSDFLGRVHAGAG